MSRPSSPLRWLMLPLFAGALVAGLSTPALAIDLQGGQFEFVLQRADGDDFVDMSTDEQDEFFNAANCACDTEFAYRITLEGIPQVDLPDVEVEMWVGADCFDIDKEPPRDCGEQDTGANCRCELVGVISDIEEFKTEQTIRINARDMMFPGKLQCGSGTATRNLYLLTDEDGDGQPDEFYDSPEQDIFVDTEPPPVPTDAEVSPGESGAFVEWKLPTSNNGDLRSFQVMCGRVDGMPIERNEKRAFADTDLICPIDPMARAARGPTQRWTPSAVVAHGPLIDAGAPDAGALDAGPEPDAGLDSPDGGTDEDPPVDLTGLVPCSNEIANTTTSVRVDGLENNVPYRMVLLSIDDRLNFSAVVLPDVTPIEVTDFWEDYKGNGGNADGGFCFVATAAFGDYDHPFVRVLRDFRDDTLASTGAGRWLIRTYYAYSPPMAAFIDRHPVAAWATRIVLAPIVAIAGLWVYSGALGKLALLAVMGLLVAWRRIRKQRALAQGDTPRRPRRVRRAIAATAAGAIALIALGASANAQPYWDEPGGPAEEQSRAHGITLHSDWAFELKFGPYKPAIDDEFSLPAMDGQPECLTESGPYECMFGGGGLMTLIELDRFFLFPSGQLGLGVGMGWFSQKAKAYAIDDDGDPLLDDDGEFVRSEGDSTTLRILPISVSAVYRFTNLDDQLGIPLVPYGKLGLSYYIWSIARPDGEVSSVPEDPMCTAEDCAQNKARGASLGWQGTLGLSIRAERIDKTMAQSLRSELGIEHSGFFVEATLADVDGFGASDKLSLGDTTWFAGINFEF